MIRPLAHNFIYETRTLVFEMRFVNVLQTLRFQCSELFPEFFEVFRQVGIAEAFNKIFFWLRFALWLYPIMRDLGSGKKES